jgi:Asp-tRNA(Asn)/Glu-tRNA(Gln) amidotransferase A subunit family amidase
VPEGTANTHERETQLKSRTSTGVAPEERRATDMTRRGFIGRTTTTAALAGPRGAGTAVAAAPAAAAPATLRTRSSSDSPLPDVGTLKGSDRDLVDHEVVELAALLQAGRLSSVELTQAYLDRIGLLNGPFETYGDNGLYNAFVRIDEESALAEARAADRRLWEGRRGDPAPWLCGIPMGFKDSIGTKGFKQQNGTLAFVGNVALEDSTPVARLRAQGVVALGITVCSAFSGSIAGTFSGNAWNLDYVPGGSSQGSGVAPIARLAAACLGEETGGSIIFPAACNGASAIKPSLGLGSTAGVMPLSPSYDVIGPICRSGRDAALIMSAILGPDPDGDPQTTFAPIPFPDIPMVPRPGPRPLRGTTIGIHKRDWVTTTTGTQRDVDPQSLYAPSHQQALDRFVGELKALGAEVKEFDGADFLVFGEDENPYYNNPDVLQVIDGSNISPSAAVINPNRYDIRYVDAVAEFAAGRPPEQHALLLNQYGRRPGGATTGERTFEAATAVLAGVSAGVRAEGERRRRRWAANYKRRFDEAGVDFMLVLTLGDKPALRANQSYPVRRNNQLANSLSFPMVSFPIGYVDGLPINADFKGPRFSEPLITQAMVDYQARHPEHHRTRPADPVPRTSAQRLGRREAAPAEEDPTLSNDPLVHEVVVA